MPSLSRSHTPATPGWTHLTDDDQLALSRAALEKAAGTIAEQAEALAGEMEDGLLADHGGPDALRLLAALVRALHADPVASVAGHA